MISPIECRVVNGFLSVQIEDTVSKALPGVHLFVIIATLRQKLVISISVHSLFLFSKHWIKLKTNLYDKKVGCSILLIELLSGKCLRTLL